MAGKNGSPCASSPKNTRTSGASRSRSIRSPTRSTPAAKVDPAFFGSIFDYIEQFMDGAHHAREDSYLFPALRQRSAEAAAVLDRLQAEHRNGPQVLADLRANWRRPQPAARATPPSRRGLAHLHPEHQGAHPHRGKDVMPLAREVLTADDWAGIDRAFLDNDDPLFGDQAAAEFRELFHRIASLAPESIGLGAHSAARWNPACPRAGDVLLKVEGLESCYGRIKALKGMDLEVRRGETVALVGANGAGKTTFLRTLSGVQPMSAGRITFDGEDISGLRSDQRVRRGICQSPEGRQVFGPLSIEDNLRLGAYYPAKGQVEGFMEKVFSMFPILKENAPCRLVRCPAASSRCSPSAAPDGPAQTAAARRAVDGSGAAAGRREVFNVVKALKAQNARPSCSSSRMPCRAGDCRPGYVLETGSVTLTGTGQELISNEQVRAAYLGM